MLCNKQNTRVYVAQKNQKTKQNVYKRCFKTFLGE